MRAGEHIRIPIFYISFLAAIPFFGGLYYKVFNFNSVSYFQRKH